MDDSQKKLYHLEGLRGWASLVVLAHHLLLAFWPTVYFGTPETSHHSLDLWTYNQAPLLGFLHSGTFSVAIFFVLSGYVMTFRFRSNTDLPRLQALAIKRYIRLCIPAGASILFAFLIWKSNLMFNQAAMSASHSIWLSWFYQNSASSGEALKEALFGSLLLGKNLYNSSLWSLSIEFYGSLLAISISLLLNPLRYLRLLTVPLICIILFYHFGTIGLWFSSIIVGWGISTLPRNISFTKPTTGILLLISIVMAGTNGSDFYQSIHSGNFQLGSKTVDKEIFFYCIGASLLVINVLHSQCLKKLFSSKPLVFFGKISFSLYVIHAPIILSFGCKCLLELTKYMRYNFAASIAFITTFVISILFAIIFERSVDRFAITCAKRFASKLTPLS